MLFRSDEHGFDVIVVCETYGLYLRTLDCDWACFDITTPKSTIESLCEACLGMVRELLCSDTRLRVLTASGKAFRWQLECRNRSQWIIRETKGLIFFNYFGMRSEYFLQNHHLPSLPRFEEVF